MNELSILTDTNVLAYDRSVPRLKIISELLTAFHTHEIRYCHWKSNEHLRASMTGDTDLDMLFDYRQRSQLERLLEKQGFRKFVSIQQKQYRDIEDYLGMDGATGKVVHVHTHYQLTMGEQYLKGYQLPLADQILKGRVYDQEFGIYCASPYHELILLYFREALKLRNRDLINVYLGRKIKYTGNSWVEYNWLRERTQPERITVELENMCRNNYRLPAVEWRNFDRKELVALRKALKNELRGDRFYSPFTAFYLRHYREFSVRSSRVLSRRLGMPISAQRLNPRGGMAVALIGADGSGKSTVTANLLSTFRQKLDVDMIYFGRGDGKKSVARKMLSSVRNMVKPEKHASKSERAQAGSKNKKRGVVKTFYRCGLALLVAREKMINLKRMHSSRKKGMLVICDRYPQNQLMGYNDGPLLYDLRNSSNPLYRAMASLEARAYKRAEQQPPDLVIKLVADAHVVNARKPGETSLEMLEQKILGIKQTTFHGSKTITVDASQPLEKVLNEVKSVIWNTYP